jgi:hypothetical protein
MEISHGSPPGQIIYANKNVKKKKFHEVIPEIVPPLAPFSSAHTKSPEL